MEKVREKDYSEYKKRFMELVENGGFNISDEANNFWKKFFKDTYRNCVQLGSDDRKASSLCQN